MTKQEILRLGELARIKLTDAEMEEFSPEIDAIIDYVGAVNDLVSDEMLEKKVGVLYNVFREDAVTNEPNSFTKDITAEFPDKQGAHLRVKKILSNDE